jgi:mannonate dehydratase
MLSVGSVSAANYSTCISRNIRGRRLDFMETFPDEGDVNMTRSLATYRDIGYRYMLMPDHVPRIDGRDPPGVAFAYCYGYIQGLIDALG